MYEEVMRLCCGAKLLNKQRHPAAPEPQKNKQIAIAECLFGGMNAPRRAPLSKRFPPRHAGRAREKCGIMAQTPQAF
jgi:hypothetical protein